MLGPGVYTKLILEKALNYAKRHESGGAICQTILELQADIGRCYETPALGRESVWPWWKNRYDSAWSPAGVNGQQKENCVFNTRPIQVKRVILQETSAKRRGYRISDYGRLIQEEA